MEPPEVIPVDPSKKTIACDGGALFGHPKVYLTFGDSGYVDCYYCGRRFLHAVVPQDESGGPQAA